MIGLTKSELVAVEIALDELTGYLDVIENEGDIDNEIGTVKLQWAERKLKAVVERYREQT